MYSTLLLRHIQGVPVWTDGHLKLALSVLPAVLRTSDVAAIQNFESRFERIGLPSLAWPIIPVTLISILFVYVGLRFRFGGR